MHLPDADITVRLRSACEAAISIVTATAERLGRRASATDWQVMMQSFGT